MTTTSPPRICIFEPTIAEKNAIRDALTAIVRAKQKIALANYMSPENTLHYRHASVWEHPANDFSAGGQMQSHSAEFLIPHQRIVDGDLALISESIESISSQMTSGIVRSFFETVSEACDKSGNVVKTKSVAEAFIEALEKIEFTVDKHGNVELPQFYIGNSAQLAELQAQSDDFVKRVTEVKKRKSDEALERERERKSKFKVPAK